MDTLDVNNIIKVNTSIFIIFCLFFFLQQCIILNESNLIEACNNFVTNESSYNQSNKFVTKNWSLEGYCFFVEDLNFIERCRIFSMVNRIPSML